MKGYSCNTEVCPRCGAKGCCNPHASYHRTLIDFIAGKPVYSRIIVCRVICTSCGHTHAVLPDVMIPYATYSLFFILRVLAEFFTHLCTVEKLCARFSITPAMLYRWKALFLDHKKLWLGVLGDAGTQPRSFLCQICRHPDYSASFAAPFVLLTTHSFLQSHRNPADFRQTVF